MTIEYKPRFIFEITDAQKTRAERLISQYGIRKAIFQPILDEVLDMVEKHGGMALGLFLSGKIKPSDVLPTLSQIKDLDDGKS
jgi:hypothetical protein